MSGVREVAEGVFVVHRDHLAVNLGVVVGAAGLLVVDTLWSEPAARAALSELRACLASTAGGLPPVVGVVNTHDHWDHVLGNGAFEAPVIASEYAAAAIGELVAKPPAGPPYAEEIASARVVVPDRTFSSVATVDLGDRAVELVHPGRGHTGGDVLVRVPDADVVFVGDLVEQAGPPSYGSDSFPLEWPTTLDLTCSLLGPGTVVVPGHGTPVDRAFAQDQRADVETVAETIRDLAARGVPVGQAVAQGSWPFPDDVVEEAVRRGYAQLPRSGRALPLV